MDLENFVVNGGTLVLLIFGLVEFAKQLGAQGNGLRVLSLAAGLALAAVFRCREIYPQWSVWIDLVFFGLAGGLTASGVYGFLDQRWPRPEEPAPGTAYPPDGDE